MHQIQVSFFAFTCFSLLWDAMSTVLGEQTRFLPMCQAVCTNTPNISPPCQNEGHQYTLSAIQELISSWKHQSKSSQERHLSFCQTKVFKTGMLTNLCCEKKRPSEKVGSGKAGSQSLTEATGVQCTLLTTDRRLLSTVLPRPLLKNQAPKRASYL